MIWFICEANTQMQSNSKKIIICEILVLFLLYPNYNACTQLVLLFCIFCTDYKYLLPSNGNPYHNNIHAADVLQTTHWMISQTGLKVSNNKLSLSQQQQQQHRIGSLILRSLPCSSLPSSMTLITQAPQTTSTSSQTPTKLSFTMIAQFWRTIMWQLFSGKILLLCTSGISGSWLKRNYMFIKIMIEEEYYALGPWLTMNIMFQDHDWQWMQYSEQHVQAGVQRVQIPDDWNGSSHRFVSLGTSPPSLLSSVISSDMSMHFTQLKLMKGLIQTATTGGRYGVWTISLENIEISCQACLNSIIMKDSAGVQMSLMSPGKNWDILRTNLVC